MSTRATVYIHGGDDELDIKLYHHRDGYVENLGQKLDKALQKWRRGMMRDPYGSKAKTLIECVASVGGFEQARPVHGDVEYIYHIWYGCESGWNEKKHKYEIKANYKLRCQSGNKYGEEAILKEPKVLLSMRWGKDRVELDWKKAEKFLGNTNKWKAGHLD